MGEETENEEGVRKRELKSKSKAHAYNELKSKFSKPNATISEREALEN